MLTGPKLYIPVQFTPSEYKPYVLTCFLDFGCQVNLARGSALPSFYWENTSGGGTVINGNHVPLETKEELFPVNFNGVSDKLTVYRLDNLSEDCVLGS